MAKLKYKLLITGEIRVETGLHIGGSEVELDIGGLDNEVIKIKRGDKRVAYIPGSSLKGKLRSLLARQKGYRKHRDDKGEVLLLFGSANSKQKKSSGHSRLIVRDCYAMGEVFTEDKAENTINRLTGDANPRHMERISPGAVFGLDMVLDICKNDDERKLLQTIDLGFQILKRDYLGGSGTRGYGKVNVTNVSVEKVVFKDDGEVEVTPFSDYLFSVNH